MKTIKFFMIAAMISFVSISYATNIEDIKVEETQTYVDIRLGKAVQDPVLLEDMVNQLTPESLEMTDNGYYTAKVESGGTTYKIIGTEKGWTRFFNTIRLGGSDGRIS